MARIRAWLALACVLVPAPLLALDPARPLDLFFHQCRHEYADVLARDEDT